jgi:hypothetical protein
MDEKLKKDLESDFQGEKIIIRRFYQEIEPQFEFRAFVKDIQLTALTQYFKSCYNPYIVENKKTILEAIQKKLVEVIKLLNTKENFVVDFAYSEKEVMVIELNPYSTQTNAGLFDWKVEKEKKIILGESPFEFRINELPIEKEEMRKMLSKDIRELIETLEKENGNCNIS